MVKKTFFCVDAHTCGNPVRVVAGGGPNLQGNSMSEKRQHFLKEYDWIRKGLMFEPRGHDMMSGSILYPPNNPDNDFGILFIETSGCLPMCGHGTIGTITIAVEEGLVTPKVPGIIKMEAPAGLVHIEYQQTGKKVDWVRLTNVKSYLAAEGLTIDCPELGEIVFDVAYGGNYYAIVDPQKNFSGVQDFTASKIVQYSQEVRKKINEKYPDYFIHPENDTIRDVSHMLWTGSPIDPTSSGRNAVFYGDKAIDRSPCGTGTSARIAQLHAKGKLKKGEEFIHESYIGSKFIGKVVEETSIGDIPAIVPSIQGWAKVYGYNNIIINESDDPYAFGFQVI
ncbi:4-hydroxyproline epimerase [Flavobacterium nitrogenifigens]|uniref:Proline racemase n=1 Tax=Flavobacterium nitrogenifigens TaxID=1617283 RepID=A0A521F5V4_9FLAO|nr:4-hydroxyproline epimerase [Flavobacterium nitrogenifigens]KAF2336671.1 4-hydroxyproline epimerase [Flavobacterium nitrogenifigens]SMO91507.1 proline racemase [Flavobacterium nitrogenifigens]